MNSPSSERKSNIESYFVFDKEKEKLPLIRYFDPYSFEHDNNLITSEKIVHLYFLTRPPDNWEARMSHICKCTGLSERTVHECVCKLEERGYLYRIHNVKTNKWRYIRCSKPTPVEEIEGTLKPNEEVHLKSKKNGGVAMVATWQQMSHIGKNELKGKKVIKGKPFIVDDNLSKDRYDVAENQQRQVPRKLLRRVNREIISNGLKNQTKPILKESKPIAPRIKELLDYHSATSHKYKPNSKAYFESAKSIQNLMSGKLFNGLNGRFAKYKDYKFTYDEIKGVLSRISIVATNPDYLPQDKSPLKLSFDKLAYNPFNDDPNFKSNFIFYFENEPKYCGNGVSLAEDLNPVITDTYRNYYKKDVVGGIKLELTNIQENKLREATKNTISFLKENSPIMSMIGISDYVDFVRLVLQGIEKEYENRLNEIEIGTFSSPRTWKKVVPTFLRSQGILR